MISRVASVLEDQYCTECGESICEGKRAVQTGSYFEHMNCDKALTDKQYVPAYDNYI